MRRDVASSFRVALVGAVLLAVPGRLLAQPPQDGTREETAPAARSTLLMAINVEGALVRVDGRDVGQSPLPALDIGPGSHTVEILHTGFHPFRWQAYLRERAFVRVNIDLVPKRSLLAEVNARDDTLETSAPQPWLTRWYVLTGIGVVALSAIVVGAVVASGGSTQDGFPVPPIEM